MSSPPPPAPLRAREFPVRGGGVWELSDEKFNQWLQTYRPDPYQPGWGEGEVYRHLMSAKQWLIDNPRRQKTRRGMNAFLGNWLRKEYWRYRASLYTLSASRIGAGGRG